MSDPKKAESITFEDFVELCKESGIEMPSMTDTETDFRMGKAISDTVDELISATENFPKFNSAHEGFAILKEEVDELWEEVRKKPGEVNNENMRKEALQIAAMAIRFAGDICHDEGDN